MKEVEKKDEPDVSGGTCTDPPAPWVVQYPREPMIPVQPDPTANEPICP